MAWVLLLSYLYSTNI